MRRICIANVDATRARLFSFEEMEAPPGEVTQDLRQRIDLCHPARRLHPGELYADPRPGSDRSPGGHTFGLEDHRASLRQMDRQFAALVVEELGRLVGEEGCREVILAAGPRMLGLLRELTGPMRETGGLTLHEIDRDLVKLSQSQLHDYLARRGLLPERERLQARA